MKKKKWTNPLLTVLVRGKPEEKILAGGICKTGIVSGPGSGWAWCNSGCADEFAPCINTGST